jgi:hypothetical protein
MLAIMTISVGKTIILAPKVPALPLTLDKPLGNTALRQA